MSTPLVVATRNPGKVREIQALLADLPVEVAPLPADAPEVPETAATFAGNAEIKARAASAGARGMSAHLRPPHPLTPSPSTTAGEGEAASTGPVLPSPAAVDGEGLGVRRLQLALMPLAPDPCAAPWILADDSGLEVDALGGAPGVLSARYGGPEATDADRVAKLLEALRGVPDEARTARFRCAVALLAPDGRLWTVEGVCEGRIAHAPRGTHGFGYDPIFLLPELGLTMAELPPEQKNRLSHRAQALAKAAELLRGLL